MKVGPRSARILLPKPEVKLGSRDTSTGRAEGTALWRGGEPRLPSHSGTLLGHNGGTDSHRRSSAPTESRGPPLLGIGVGTEGPRLSRRDTGEQGKEHGAALLQGRAPTCWDVSRRQRSREKLVKPSSCGGQLTDGWLGASLTKPAEAREPVRRALLRSYFPKQLFVQGIRGGVRLRRSGRL